MSRKWQNEHGESLGGWSNGPSKRGQQCELVGKSSNGEKWTHLFHHTFLVCFLLPGFLFHWPLRDSLPLCNSVDASQGSVHWPLPSFFFFFKFVWLRQVLVAASGIFVVSCGIFSMHCTDSVVWAAAHAASVATVCRFSSWAFRSASQLFHGMWDLRSMTRSWTHVPCIARQILHHWATRGVPGLLLLKSLNLLLSYLIYSQDFDNHLFTDNSKIYNYLSNLFSELQICGNLSVYI